MNELSDRKALLKYILKLEDAVDRREKRLLRLRQSEDNASSLTKLSDEATELRALVGFSKEDLVFIRTENSLLLADTSEEVQNS